MFTNVNVVVFDGDDDGDDDDDDHNDEDDIDVCGHHPATTSSWFGLRLIIDCAACQGINDSAMSHLAKVAQDCRDKGISKRTVVKGTRSCLVKVLYDFVS